MVLSVISFSPCLIETDRLWNNIINLQKLLSTYNYRCFCDGKWSRRVCLQVNYLHYLGTRLAGQQRAKPSVDWFYYNKKIFCSVHWSRCWNKGVGFNDRYKFFSLFALMIVTACIVLVLCWPKDMMRGHYHFSQVCNIEKGMNFMEN